jgi:hypothetical protein
MNWTQVAGIAAIVGGGYFAIANLRALYGMGCHRPASLLVGSIGALYLGLRLVQSKPKAEGASSDE